MIEDEAILPISVARSQGRSGDGAVVGVGLGGLSVGRGLFRRALTSGSTVWAPGRWNRRAETPVIDASAERTSVPANRPIAIRPTLRTYQPANPGWLVTAAAAPAEEIEDPFPPVPLPFPPSPPS
jgi:hypothetical protein